MSRAVEIQPCFNRDIVSELSDRATTALLDCSAWAEGDGTQFGTDLPNSQTSTNTGLERYEADSDLLDAIYQGDLATLKELITRFDSSTDTSDLISKAFVTAVSQAPDESLELCLDTGLVNLHQQDEINGRNCLHKAAMVGRLLFVQAGLQSNVSPLARDVYGRIPLHYACMNGHVDITQLLLEAQPDSVDVKDLDMFTALVHSIVNSHISCVKKLLHYSARVDPGLETDQNPLNLACQNASVPIVELLLANNPQIKPDAEGLFPQHLVARFGRDPHLLLSLRHKKADLDQPDKLYAWTPLFHAASEGNVECLKMLLDCGARTDLTDEKGLSAQYYAMWEGHVECMAILATARAQSQSRRPSEDKVSRKSAKATKSIAPNSAEMIPDLSLPPPMVPTRRYGHNFLEGKSLVLIVLEQQGKHTVKFYDESKYPAARLTITPRFSDVLPRNLLLPIQDENKSVTFEIDDVNNFALDFDVFPTFGKKVIAKGSVPPQTIREVGMSSTHYQLALYDPRLRAVGELSLTLQVVTPLGHGGLDKGFELAPFETYWKATSQLESKPSSQVTGSSLSGEYVRVYVQVTRDCEVVVHPNLMFEPLSTKIPVRSLDLSTFRRIGESQNPQHSVSSKLTTALNLQDLHAVHSALRTPFTTLHSILKSLPVDIHVDLHLLLPSREEETSQGLESKPTLNNFVDRVLHTVYHHIRQTRQDQSLMRSIIFTSYNADVCAALNWKQPNYAVLLCNDLGISVREHEDALQTFAYTNCLVDPHSTARVLAHDSPERHATVKSIKEAVKIAQANNLMGLICRARLFEMEPKLVEAIKVAGLVLVADGSRDVFGSTDGVARGVEDTIANKHVREKFRELVAQPLFQSVPEGIDGVLREGGVLKFAETVDV